MKTQLQSKQQNIAHLFFVCILPGDLAWYEHHVIHSEYVKRCKRIYIEAYYAMFVIQ